MKILFFIVRYVLTLNFRGSISLDEALDLDASHSTFLMLLSKRIQINPDPSTGPLLLFT